MPYVSMEALRENQELHEAKDSRIGELEEDVAEKDELIAALMAEYQRMMVDRSVAVSPTNCLAPD